MSINSIDFNTTYNTSNKKALASTAPDADTDNSIFSNPAEKRGSVNSWLNEKIGYKTGCTDNKDDGKLSFGDKLKSIGRGALNFVTNIVESVKEHPIQTLLTVGAVVVGSAAVVAVGIISAPALAIGGAAIGLVMGAVKMGEGITKASKAETDAEAKQAYESIGEGGATVATSALTMGKAVKTYKNGLNTARTSAAESATSAQESANNASNSASKANEAVNSAAQSAESAKTSAKTATDAANSSTKIAAEVTDDAIKQSSTLAENAAQNARSASQTAQEALANTTNNAGMSTNAAKEATQYAEKAMQASEKANQTWSLVHAQKSAQSGINAAKGAKTAAEIASSSADDALKFADGAAKAASEAAKYATDASKSLSSTEEAIRSLDTAEINNAFKASLDELREGVNGIKISCNQKNKLMRKNNAELVIEQENSVITIRKSPTGNLCEVSIDTKNIQPTSNSPSTRQIEALREYVVETNGFKRFNAGTEALAEGRPIEPKVQQIIDDLTNLIDSQKPIKAGTKVYRTEGYEVFDQIKLEDGTKLSNAMRQAAESGDVDMIERIKVMLTNGEFGEVRQPHFLSTSSCSTGTFDGKILWESTIAEGSKGVRANILLDYMESSGYQSDVQLSKLERLLQYLGKEQEILFQRSSNITITGIDYDYHKAKWILQGIIRN